MAFARRQIKSGTGLAVLAVVSAALALAYDSDVHQQGWKRDSATGCRIWTADPRPDKTVGWAGECPGGTADGRGSLTRLVDGAEPIRFEGSMVGGKMHGHGTIVWPAGNRYDGDFFAGKRTGRGTYIWGPGTQWAGDRYEGDFVDGKRTGTGTYFWSNGDRYQGDFIDGSRTGRGTLVWANGGRNVNGRASGARDRTGLPIRSVGGGDDRSDAGEGLTAEKLFRVATIGTRYVGDFVDGERTGIGMLLFGSGSDRAGDQYEGAFVDAKRTGQGKYFWANGDYYEGGFRDGKRSGFGTFVSVDGERYLGRFKDDKRSGRGKLLWPNGDRYEGDFVNGKRTGYGVYRWANGDRYEGYFRNNRAIGDGVFIEADGTRHKAKSGKSPPSEKTRFPVGRQKAGNGTPNLGQGNSITSRPRVPPASSRRWASAACSGG